MGGGRGRGKGAETLLGARVTCVAGEAVNAVKEKRARFGSVEELKKDLLDNDV